VKRLVRPQGLSEKTRALQKVTIEFDLHRQNFADLRK